MNLKNENIEYRTQKHEMLVDGTSDEKPDVEEILDHAMGRGFNVTEIEIFMDEMQGFWRFSGKLTML